MLSVLIPMKDKTEIVLLRRKAKDLERKCGTTENLQASQICFTLALG